MSKKILAKDAKNLIYKYPDIAYHNVEVTIADNPDADELERASEATDGIIPTWVFEKMIYAKLNDPFFRQGVETFHFVEDGQDLYKCHCRNCGESFVLNRNDLSRMNKTCPVCGKKQESTLGDHFGTFSFIREFDPDCGYCILTTVAYVIGFDKLTNKEAFGDYDIRNQRKYFGIRKVADSVFGLKFGLLLNLRCPSFATDIYIAESHKLCTHKNARWARIMDSLTLNGKFLSDRKSNDFIQYLGESALHRDSVISILHRHHDAIVKGMEEKKSKAVSKTVDEKYPGFLDPVTDEEFENFFKKNSENQIMLNQSSQKGNHLEALAHCTCGKEFTVVSDDDSMHENVSITCPNCGAERMVRRYTLAYEFCKVTRSAHKFRLLPDGKILAMCKEEFMEFSYRKFQRKIIDEAVVIARKSFQSYILVDGKWTKSKRADRHYRDEIRSPITGCCMNSADEMREIIDGSCLAYMGLLEAWGIADGHDGIEPMGNIQCGGYLDRVMRMPVMEKLVKAGLYNMAKMIVKYPNKADLICQPKAASLTEALGVSKKCLRALRAMDCEIDMYHVIKGLYEADQNMNSDTWERLVQVMEKGSGSYDSKSGYYIVIDVAKNYGLSINRICDYMESCYYNQCIPAESAIKIWRDYLRMAKFLKYNLKKSSDCMPGSLKKEHDRASFAYEAVQQEVARKQFIERAEENSVYAYKDREFAVIVPALPEDVVAEGVALKHCVGSYVEAITEGRSVICFVRRQEDPEKPYFTLEIVRDSISQLRGFDNKLPDEKELKDFIRKFAAKKKLSIGCYV